MLYQLSYPGAGSNELGILANRQGILAKLRGDVKCQKAGRRVNISLVLLAGTAPFRYSECVHRVRSLKGERVRATFAGDHPLPCFFQGKAV